MNQYERSGPPAEQKPADEIRTEITIRELQDTVRRQQTMIESLQKDVRRLREKIDRHADYLNGNQRG